MDIMTQPQPLHFKPDSKIPNNPVLPTLIYRQVLDRQTANKDKLFKRHFQQSGWRGGWTGFVFDYHHFHTTSHEALAVARGRISLLLGGENGKKLDLEAGDLIVLPAGTGHKMISSSENLVIVGAYPEGQEEYDICRSLYECPDAEEKIANFALPVSDPFYGAAGPLLKEWKV